ncbi:caspase domain-containing protein [Streptomyces sp. NPDC086023]|uniref:caspase domain-containing protein n=1 Tax=Streptomyces sp. NPDC086023 TaxID=3365746 RepID=UPI0037D7A24C
MARLRFPHDIGPSPVRDLLLWMHRLHGRAGAPGVRDMAEAVGCSRHKIHDMLTSGRCPHDARTLFRLAGWLDGRTPRPRVSGDEESEDRFYDELDALWDAAMTFELLEPPELPPPVVPAGRVPPHDDEEPVRTEREETPEADSEGPFGVAGDEVVGPVVRRSPSSSGISPSRPVEMPDPGRSRCLLVATGAYDHLSDLPGDVRAAEMLAEVLTAPWPEPAFDRLDVLLDPEDPRDVLGAVHAAADEADDVLMLYFSGHGLVSRRGKLQLATRSTRPDADYTAVQYDDIRELVSSSRAKRSLIVLDACYSGRALDVMGPHSGLQEAPSTYLLASSGADAASFVDDQGLPVFTRHLTEVLAVGDAEAPEVLTVRDIYQLINRRARREGYPTPMLRANHAGHPLALARNAALMPVDRAQGSVGMGAGAAASMRSGVQ